MSIGYDRPLYILPFDHRASFATSLFRFSGPLSEAQAATIAASKQVIYDAFRLALQQGVPHDAAGILVDEQYGAAILRDARAHGYITCAPAETSGQPEFQFEYRDMWQQHIASADPTFVKVLVRYNPEGDAEMNRRQATRLHELSDYVHQVAKRLMFELLVPMTPDQGKRVKGEQRRYDQEMRPSLMIGAIEALQTAGVEPDIWKVEGLANTADCAAITAVAQRAGREHVGCIVLGRGADHDGIVAWLRTAAAVPGFIGFAVGRTSFWDALVALRDGKISREAAAQQIAGRYLEWVRIFQEARGAIVPARRAANA